MAVDLKLYQGPVYDLRAIPELRAFGLLEALVPHAHENPVLEMQNLLYWRISETC